MQAHMYTHMHMHVCMWAWVNSAHTHTHDGTQTPVHAHTSALMHATRKPNVTDVQAGLGMGVHNEWTAQHAQTTCAYAHPHANAQNS